MEDFIQKAKNIIQNPKPKGDFHPPDADQLTHQNRPNPTQPPCRQVWQKARCLRSANEVRGIGPPANLLKGH